MRLRLKLDGFELFGNVSMAGGIQILPAVFRIIIQETGYAVSSHFAIGARF